MKIYFVSTYLERLMPRISSTGFALLLFSSNLFAGSANLAWNASTSTNLGGYIVSYGQSSGNYSSSVDVGNTTSYTVSGLQAGATYYFAVKDYDLARTVQSAYSNEVSLTIPAATALTADFTENTTSGVASLAVNFTPVTTGTVTSWAWAFPGSYTPSVTNTTGQVTTATYSTAGTYSVSLTVTGPGGSVTKTYPNLITVTPAPVLSPAPAPAPVPVKIPTPVTGTSNNGLVAAYGFEEIGGTTVVDASGKTNHGTLTNAVRVATGHRGNALQFNGINAWVTVNNSASLDFSAGMTLEAWVYPQTMTNGGKTVIMKEQSGGEVYSLYAREDDNLPVSYFNDGNYHGVFGQNPLPLNQWTHLVGTYDGKYQRLYVNGSQVAMQAQNSLIQQSTGVLRIGGNSLWGEYFQGYIDEVRIYNRALNTTEVNYNLTTAISVSNPPQLVMGNKTLEPLLDSDLQGQAEAFQVISAKSGLDTSVQVYLNISSTATQLIAGIYNDINGHPGSLVARGKLSTLRYGAWNLVSIPAVSINASQPYWIAILGLNGQIAFLDQNGSGSGLNETSALTTLTDLPGKWVTGSVYHDGQASIFGNGY